MTEFSNYVKRRKNKNEGIGGDIVDATQQGIIQTGSDIASFFGAEETSKSLENWAQEQTHTMSDEGRRAMAKRFVNEDLSLGEGVKDWRAWLLNGANIIGGIASTGGGAGAVGKGVAMIGKAAKAGKAGVVAGHASNLGTNMLLNAAAGSGGQASAVEKDVMALSFSDLQSSPEFSNLAIQYSDQGLSDFEALSKARADIAKKAGDSVRGDFSLAAINGIAGMVGDQAMGRLIKGSIGRTVKGAVAKGVLAEAPTEAGQSAYSQYVGNIEKAKALGVEADPMKGVAATALESAMLGGAVGGAAGTAGGTVYRTKQHFFEKSLNSIITPEVVTELQASGSTEAVIRQQLHEKASNAAISRGFDLNHAKEIADNAINYAFGVSGSADQNYTAEPQPDTEPGEAQQTPTQEAPAQQPPAQDIPPQQQEPPQQADLEFTQQAFDSAKPSDLTIDLQAAIGEMKAELDADRSNERARSAKQDLERYLSLLPNASNEELETTRNIAKRIVNDYWGIVDEVEAEVQQKAPDQQPAMQDTPPAAMDSGRGLTFETATTQLGEAIDRGELAFVDEAAQQDARFADGLRAAMEISPAAVLEVARLRKAGQMSEDQAISALQRIINSVQKPDDQLTPDERELELRAERNRELAHRRAQELEEGVDPGKYQGRGFQYQKDQAFTSGARAEPTPSGERSINEPFVTGLEDQRVQDAPQVEFDRWSDVQEGDQDVDARDYDSPYTDRPQTKEVEQDTVFQQREAGDRQPSPERTTEDWLSDFRGQPGGILKDPSLPSVSGSSERIKKKRRKEQDAEKSAILERAGQSEKNGKTASEVSTDYIPNEAMQNAIVDAVVVDKQKVEKREENVKSELRNHEKEVTTLLTSEIFNNMIDGKPELAKANRKWALKKALKALNSVIDSDHSRAKALVTKLDKLYRKESKGKWGIMAVAGGSRSNLGKRIDALLSDNATPPDGSGTKKPASETPKPEPKPKAKEQSNRGQTKNYDSLEIKGYLDQVIAMNDGELSYEEFMNLAKSYISREEELKEQLNSMTIPNIKKMMGRTFAAYHADYKKADIVKAAYNKLLDNFEMATKPRSESGVYVTRSYVFGEERKPRTEMVLESINKFTPEQYEEFAKFEREAAAKREAELKRREEGLKNPKTLEDFIAYGNSKGGISGFTPEELKQYDALFLERELERKAKETVRKAEVKSISGVFDFETEETTHSKTGEPRYVVRLTGERLDRDKFKELANKARQLKGNFVNAMQAKRWNTVDGFQFASQENRDQFVTLLEGENVDRSKQLAERSEKKREVTFARLRELADNREDRAEDVINQDRKTNTAKRALEASYAVDRGYKEQESARTIKSILEAAEAGEIKILSNITAMTQLEQLEKVNNNIIWHIPEDKREQFASQNRETGRWTLNSDVSIDDIAVYAKFPNPSQHVNRLEYLAGQMEDVSGFKQAAKKIRSNIKGKDGVVMLSGRAWDSVIPKIRQFAGRGDSYQAEAVKEVFIEADRLHRMGINSMPELRTALRELEQVRVKSDKPKETPVSKLTKKVEDTIRGNRNAYIDFFPTPDKESSDLVQRAEIEPGMDVLEPNAGMGHVADKLRETGANVDVVEYAYTMNELLKAKGHNVVGSDFLEYKPTKQYDRIVMNPPFSDDMDIDHINHAYSLLKPGGRIVAISSAMAGDRGNSKNKNFRQFLDTVGAVEEPLPEGAFKSSLNPTDVATKFIEIEKPENESDIAPPADIRFSQTNATASKGMKVEDVQRIAQDFLNGYKGLKDANISVVKSQDDLAQFAQTDPGKKVKAVWLSGDNRVVLVADHLGNQADVNKALRHELIAHNGVFENLSASETKDLTNKVLKLRANSKLKDIFSRIDNAYKNSPDSVKAEEVIAKLAEVESGAIRKIADRVMAMVMGALRRSGILAKDNITIAEVRDLINQTDKYLRKSNGTRTTSNVVRFSQEDAVEEQNPTKSIEEALMAKNKSQFSAVKSILKKGANAVGFDKMRQNKYALLTLRQISEVGKKYLGSSLDNYVSTVNEIQVSQNDIVMNVIDKVEGVKKWSDANKQESDRLWSLMHKFTLENVDPAVPYQDLTDILKEEQGRLERRLKSTGGDRNAHVMKELNEVRKELKREPFRKKKHAELAVEYHKLPHSTKKQYKLIRDHYIKMREDMMNTLMERVTSDVLSNHVRSALFKKIRLDNERAKRGLYVPLARFGDYWLNAVDKSGERHFFMYESQSELDVAKEALEEAGYKIQYGQKLEQAQAVDGASMGFVSDVIDELKGANINDKARETLTDSVYQLYLQAMPERSLRRSFIHRKGVAGFSEDGLRAMADNGVKQARQQARLQHDGKLVDTMEELRKAASNPNNVEGHRIYNEMLKRHDWVMNPSRAPWAQKLTGLGFFWMLGLSPASALVNLTQIAQVAIPVIGAKYGVGKTSREMLTASREFMTAFPASTKGDPRLGVLGNVLEGDELDALKQAIRTGTIDVTQAADLMGLAENPSAQYDGKWHKAMNVVGWAFHKAEVFNREVTFIAAYRLAKQNPKLDHKGAIDEAIKMTWDSHFDYGSLNRARFMQSDMAAVALQFKQYSQNMTYYLFKSLSDSVRGETPEVKKRAAKQLLWTMGLTFGIGGLNALPLWMITQTADIAMAAAEGLGIADDEEPWDSETELKKMLSEYFGKEISQFMFYGSSASISGRISLNELWVRSPWSDEPKGMYQELIQQGLGPVIGGIGVSFASGIQNVFDGHTWRGVEQMVPKWSKDILKAVRYVEEEGIANKNGDYLISDVNYYETAAQALGFIPGRLVTRYDQNNALKGYERSALKRRSNLLNAYWIAHRTRDSATKRELRREIAKYNRSRWGRVNPITQDNIDKSIRRRQSNSSKTESGARFNEKYSRLLNESKYWD